MLNSIECFDCGMNSKNVLKFDFFFPLKSVRNNAEIDRMRKWGTKHIRKPTLWSFATATQRTLPHGKITDNLHQLEN